MNNWDGINELKKITYEVVGTANPISFDLGAFGTNIQSIEIQRFYHNEASGTVRFIGIIGQGCSSQCNEYNKRTDVILTVPSTNGVFDYLAQDGNFDGYLYSKGTNVDLGFIVRDGGSAIGTDQASPMVFNSNYLLKIIFEVSN